MLNRFYNWIMNKAASPRANAWLAGFGVAESSFFPIPVDIMLAPMVLARPGQARRLALIVIMSTIIGAVLGYMIGAWLMDYAGAWIIQAYHYEAAWNDFQSGFQTHGLLILLIVGFTPIPYKLAAIASGALAIDPMFFLLATLLAKAPRYGLQVWLLSRYGEAVRHFTERHLTLVFTGLTLLIVLSLRFLLPA